MKNYHIDPEEAVKIHKEVKSRKSIGIHWGTFAMTDEVRKFDYQLRKQIKN